MSIRLYCGEYLVSPIPVHFGLNWCTHGCFYCFANLNQPGRRAENSDLSRLYKWHRDQAGPIEWWYLSRGYPLLVANDSDPFARSNKDTFLALHDLAGNIGVPLAYQTKGGDAECEQLALDGPKTMIYVTVTSDDEDLLRQTEPGAPGYAHRLDFIRRAVAAGHYVIVGMNPLVPGWWHDAEQALEDLHATGARHIWAGDLHLSRFQIDAMTPTARARWQEWTRYGLKRAKPDGHITDHLLWRAEQRGFNVFLGAAGSTLGFWDDYFRLGFPFQPTIDGLYQALHQAGGGQPVAFTFDAFDAWSDTGAPREKSIYREFLSGYGRSIRNDGLKAEARSLREVHEWEWKFLDYPTRLRNRELCIATDEAAREYAVDDAGRPVLVYVPGGTDALTWPAREVGLLETIPRVTSA